MDHNIVGYNKPTEKLIKNQSYSGYIILKKNLNYVYYNTISTNFSFTLYKNYASFI